MGTDNKTTRVGCIILIVLIIAAQVAVFLTPETNTLMKTGTAVSTIALLAAMIYALKGFGKNAATFFMIYMLLYSLSEIADLIALIMKAVNLSAIQPFMILITAFTIIALIILAMMKDLGRKVSFALVTAVMLLNLIAVIISITAEATQGAVIGLPVSIIRGGQRLLLSVVAYMLVNAKYEDKEARGTK